MQSGETRIHRIRLEAFVRLEALAHRDDPVDRQQAVQRLIVELGADNKRDGIVRTSRDHATQHGREGDFERWGGYAPDGCVGWIAPCPLLQRCRDVVAIEPATPPIREGRRHRPTSRIEEAPGQRGIRLLLAIRCPAAGVRVEARLDGREEIAIDDGLVPAGMRPPLVDDQAEIDSVAQQLKERATAERPAAG